MFFWLWPWPERAFEPLYVVEVDVPQSGAESLGFDAVFRCPSGDGAGGYAGEDGCFSYWSKVACW